MTGPTVLAEPAYYTQFGGTTRWVVADQYDTIAHVQTGDDVTEPLHAITGFTATAADLPITRAGSSWQGAVPGRITPDDSSGEWYADPDPANDIRSILTVGQETNILKFPAGMGTGKTMTVFKVRVKSVIESSDIEAVPTIVVGFTLLEAPDTTVYPAS